MTCILVPVHIASWIFICHLCEPPLSPHSFSNGCSCRIPRNWFFLAFRHLCFVLCPCLFCILIVVRNISIQYLTCIWVKELGKRINGCYTQLLRCMDISWRDHQTNKNVYGNIPSPLISLRKRRLQFAGHCLCTSDQSVSQVDILDSKLWSFY